MQEKKHRWLLEYRWVKLGRNAMLKGKHKWSDEKPKLDSDRRLRGIYFIDPEDKKFKETIRNARRKLETPMAPAFALQDTQEKQAWRDPWQD